MMSNARSCPALMGFILMGENRLLAYSCLSVSLVHSAELASAHCNKTWLGESVAVARRQLAIAQLALLTVESGLDEDSRHLGILVFTSSRVKVCRRCFVFFVVAWSIMRHYFIWFGASFVGIWMVTLTFICGRSLLLRTIVRSAFDPRRPTLWTRIVLRFVRTLRPSYAC